ncbi:MAG: DUF3860 domain-containing protein, partial [Candidatus Poseidoniales archaeon]
MSIGNVENNLLQSTKVCKIHLYFSINCNQVVHSRSNHYISGLAPWKQRHILTETCPNDRRKKTMKTTRIREKIKKFLGDRPRNTAEILEHINSTMRHG